MSTTIRASSFEDIFVQAGSKLTVVVAAGGSALARRNSGGTLLESVTLAPGETRVFGPFLFGMHIRLDCVAGSLAYTAAEDTDSSSAEITGGPMGVGAVPAALAAVGTVDVAEWGTDAQRKTVLTLDALPVVITDDAGVGGWGTVKLYDFPAGLTMIKGAVIDADIALTEAWWTDAAAGDVSLGTAANADGTALDSTLQNIIPTTEIAVMTAQAGPIDAQSTATERDMIASLAGAAAAAAILNFRIDDQAAHFPDIITNGAFTGNATSWTLGAGWAYGTNNVAATLASAVLQATLTSPLVSGVSYSLAFDATRSAGSVRASVGGTLGTARSSSATFTETIVAGADGTLKLTGTGFSGTIDNVICTPLSGNGVITGTVTIVHANLGNS